ncbi:MAG: helix-turn-helix transcriptional regulator [Lachnospiraceae bacterium]
MNTFDFSNNSKNSPEWTEYLEAAALDAVLLDLLEKPTPQVLETVSHIPLLLANTYQVVIYENYHPHSNDFQWTFADFLRVTNTGNNSFHHIRKDDCDIILLKGNHALSRFHDCLSHYGKKVPPQHGSLLDSLFLAYGRPVTKPKDICISYSDAHTLIKQRFFCSKEAHTLGYEHLPEHSDEQNALTTELRNEYAELLIGYIQTLHKKDMGNTLEQLRDILTKGSCNERNVRLFLLGLYMQVREKIAVLYHNHTIPFTEYGFVINSFLNENSLSDIIQYMYKEFEMVIRETGNPTRNDVMDDLLAYIDHNFSSNLKLENIAPFFGYNSAYLGKLFTKTTGQSFNTYIDNVRIDQSKDLLRHSTLKVYEIAEKVGYNNVDYFHKKFRKYTGESPAQFRKKQIVLKESGN